MPKKLFDLTEDDLAALERVRAARGLRSHAETLRALIREAEAAPAEPAPANPEQIPEPLTPKAKPAAKAVAAEAPANPPKLAVSVPFGNDVVRRPYQKGARR